MRVNSTHNFLVLLHPPQKKKKNTEFFINPLDFTNKATTLSLTLQFTYYTFGGPFLGFAKPFQNLIQHSGPGIRIQIMGSIYKPSHTISPTNILELNTPTVNLFIFFLFYWVVQQLQISAKFCLKLFLQKDLNLNFQFKLKNDLNKV